MINFYDQVPSVYPTISRDFQYLSWLINIVLNSVKHNVDDLYDLPNAKADTQLTELLALTLGFKVKRNYDKKQLSTLVSIIPWILKYKGTEEAIRMAGEALITAAGAEGMFMCEVRGNSIEILLPAKLVDITLFLDLLPYILPAGMTCRVVRKTQVQKVYTTKVNYDDIVRAEWYKDVQWDNDKQTSVGPATMLDVPSDKPEFTNYKYPITADEAGKAILKLNAGLLDNSIIPTLDESLTDITTNPKEEEN